MKASDERSCMMIMSWRQCLSFEACERWSLYVLKCWEGRLEELKEDHSLAQKRRICNETSSFYSENPLPNKSKQCQIIAR